MSETFTGNESYPHAAVAGSSLARAALEAWNLSPEDEVTAPYEKQLLAAFPDMVAEIPLHAVAKVISGSRGRRLMARLDDYRLVPVIGTGGSRSTDMARTDNMVPDGVKVDCEHRYYSPGELYLDTKYGIGLVYKDRLCGLAASHLGTYTATDGELAPSMVLVQNQAVTPAAHGETGDGERSGLREGLLWRETLARSWAHVAGQMGIGRMVIGSAHGNRWNKHHEVYPWRDEQLRAALDEVADHLHYTFVPGEASSHWYQDI